MGHPTAPPPSYEETIAAGPVTLQPPQPSTISPTNPAPPPPIARPSSTQTTSDAGDNRSVMLDPILSEDPSALHALIVRQARTPPRPYLTVRGSHTETREDSHDTTDNNNTNNNNNNKSTRNETVVDFDFKIDLYKYMVRDYDAVPDYEDEVDAAPNEEEDRDGWRVCSVVRDGDGQEAYRGGRSRSATWAGHTRRSGGGHVEDASEGEIVGLVGEEGEEPGLMGWCDRFCLDPGPVKSFRFTRSIVGFDVATLRSLLISHLRNLNYHGNIDISITLANKKLTIYSPHWINELRNNSFAYWFCIILQLWIITWPVIWFLEHRYDVVRAVWYFSRVRGSQTVYACHRDEAAIAKELAPIVTQAAWERRRNGKMLTANEMDLLRQLGTEGSQRRVVMVSWDHIGGWGRDS
ncbi:uncharacterized protein BO95DRAFT_354221 [Aspergillus brunneoviolaceus CBS 621.78]|uniref:Uncharacterized protein n=1 Tax=Aspergillus brunneoviolaceus CBS 621.78 TaxID=1450534 RepID=A0ACD1GJV7_9EURO|nr:hypothetical protein BO95DRAFT_354221 [Aspergillus brunneoviolaceus CBS 621.78]RAH49543.1 hypothetical protein BO95DRAFT_354221 [Aspergillus brunneoviolaceus CBS 621.78]